MTEGKRIVEDERITWCKREEKSRKNEKKRVEKRAYLHKIGIMCAEKCIFCPEYLHKSVESSYFASENEIKRVLIIT